MHYTTGSEAMRTLARPSRSQPDPRLEIAVNQRGDAVCSNCGEPWERAEVREWAVADLCAYGVGTVESRDGSTPWQIQTLDYCPCCG